MYKKESVKSTMYFNIKFECFLPTNCIHFIKKVLLNICRIIKKLYNFAATISKCHSFSDEKFNFVYKQHTNEFPRKFSYTFIS